MKQFKFFLLAVAAICGMVLTSCEKDPVPEPEPEPEDLVEKYFDLWVAAGTDEVAYLVRNVADVSDPNMVIDYKNTGADITAKLDEEIIFKDGYYYEIPISADRFGKYQIYDGKLTTMPRLPASSGPNSIQRICQSLQKVSWRVWR